MNHVSDLRVSTICGIRNIDLPNWDRSLAALIPETQAEVNCPECKRIMGLGKDDNS